MDRGVNKVVVVQASQLFYAGCGTTLPQIYLYSIIGM